MLPPSSFLLRCLQINVEVNPEAGRPLLPLLSLSPIWAAASVTGSDCVPAAFSAAKDHSEVGTQLSAIASLFTGLPSQQEEEQIRSGRPLHRAHTGLEMDTSPLGLLPAELRTVIYDLVAYIPGGVAIKFKPCDITDEKTSTPLRAYVAPLAVVQGKQLPLALAATCRHVRAEALGSFYAVNSFSAIAPALHCSLPEYDRIAALRRWLDGLGHGCRSKLHQLQLDLGYWTWEPPYVHQAGHAKARGKVDKQIIGAFPDFTISKVDSRVDGQPCSELDRESLGQGLRMDDLRPDDQAAVADHADFYGERHSCYDEALTLSGYGAPLNGVRICRVCTWSFEIALRVVISGRSNCGD